VWSGGENSQVPQDIRIMQRIVRTALDEVEPPELPEALQADAEASGAGANAVLYNAGDSNAAIWTVLGGRNRAYSIGGRDVSGFYMQGYGYLFTVKWRVGPGGNALFSGDIAVARAAELEVLATEARRAAAAADAAEARAAGEAERTLEQERDRLEARQAEWDSWATQYRDVLAESLRGVVANYGSTLQRAAADESITFIADFGGGETETVTVSVRRGQLTGAGGQDNLAAVEMMKGETGVSDRLRTELKIMEEIIDSSLQGEGAEDTWVYSDYARYFGGDSSYQYVPGYGVLFHKAARLNLATRVIRQANPDRVESGVVVAPFRQRIEETTEEQQQVYAQHLADLKQKTAEFLATYGPTLTELEDDDWVGVFYNVGSAAGLLEGGISNFLVQARMADIRQAGREGGAGWLVDQLVTNEKQD
jgi:hypothetical protein